MSNHIWKKISLWFWILCMTSISILPVVAEESQDTIALQPVYTDTPYVERAKEREYGSAYPIRMVKVQNETAIKNPPQSAAAILYYAQVQLGPEPSQFGILCDLQGDTKQLWVDRNGDGDFSTDKPYEIYKSDKYPGFNIYYAPVPLEFEVPFRYADHSYTVPLRLDMAYLVIAQNGFADYLYLRNRTWFTGVISTQDDLRVALVDANDDVIYNGPSDRIFLDTDYDLNFRDKEGKALKNLKSFKLKSQPRYKLDYTNCPESLILKKG